MHCQAMRSMICRGRTKYRVNLTELQWLYVEVASHEQRLHNAYAVADRPSKPWKHASAHHAAKRSRQMANNGGPPQTV